MSTPLIEWEAGQLYYVRNTGVIYTDDIGEPFWLSGNSGFEEAPAKANPPMSTVRHIGPTGDLFNRLEDAITERYGL